jgi:multiple sugar transport system substrate-binding protein
LPAVADEQLSEMRARAQSVERDVDVFNLDVTWTAEFAENDWIRPLAGVDDTGFLDQPLETCRYRDKLWALPFNTDAGLLFYRPAHLKARGVDAERADVKARPPRSWDTLTRLIDTAFAGPLPAGDRLEAGYAAQFGDYEGLTVNAMEAIWAADGEVVDSDGNVRLDSEEASDALQQPAPGGEQHSGVPGPARAVHAQLAGRLPATHRPGRRGVRPCTGKPECR